MLILSSSAQSRLLTAGLTGLQDRPRSAAPRKHGPELRKRILAQLELVPPEGFGHWDSALASEHVGGARVAGLGHFAHRRQLSGA